MNSVILLFSSSGEGNGGGGGFCVMCGETSCQRTVVATIRLKSDSHARDSFIRALSPIPTRICIPILILAHARALI